MSDDWEKDCDDFEDEWDDEDEEETEDEATGLCPECRLEIDVDAEMCPACGYWLTTADRHAIWDGASPVRGWMRVGKVVLVAVLIALMSGLVVFF